MTVVDDNASTSCRGCDVPARCFREWQIFRDGDVHVFYTSASYCGCCHTDSESEEDSESGFEDTGVCEDLSGKSTWEVCWENYTGEPFYDRRRDEVRVYVLERLKDG